MWSKALRSLLMVPTRKIIPNKNLIVLITGCDSGLGLLLAETAHQKGFSVIAGVLQGSESAGARHLKATSNLNTPLHILDLDITQNESVERLKSFTKNLLNDGAILHAVVNNAGIMVMGDFDWQTESIIQKQWSVNVCGTWRLTKSLLPGLRDAVEKGGRPRIININSHCGEHTLRTMSVYSATKAALRAWAEGLRMELEDSGIYVIDYVPGRVAASDILKNQRQYFDDMRASLDTEQLAYYGNYFDRYVSYICAFVNAPDNDVCVQELKDKFVNALLNETPHTVYKTEPWRYKFYYSLFKITPRFMKNWLMKKFLLLPSLKDSK